jgi:mycothiol synthase
MTLPAGYAVRHPLPEEAASIQSLLDACETADTGEPRTHENDIVNEWRSDQCRPAEDWWVATAEGGGIVAVGWVWPETAAELTADHYVHPDHRGRGLGDVMLDLIETRASEIAAATEGSRPVVVVWCEDSDVVRRASIDRRGFAPVRQYFEMAIALDDEPAAPRWPEGIEPRRLRPGDESAVYRADQEAFAAHHLFEPRPYDEWLLFHVDATDADVTLWWLAWAGEELAGYVIPYETDHGAVIGDLGVRAPYRGRGIGRALLLAAFGILRERGQKIARLFVDAQNVTNAVRVYEAAGMHVARRFDVLEKRLG